MAAKPADAGHVGIEHEGIAGEAQPRRHVELDDLLAKPAGHHEEPAERREEVAFGTQRDVHARQPRQAGADEVLVARRRHDQQFQRTAIPPMAGQRSNQKTGALQGVLAMQAPQDANGKIAWQIPVNMFRPRGDASRAPVPAVTIVTAQQVGSPQSRHSRPAGRPRLSNIGHPGPNPGCVFGCDRRVTPDGCRRRR